MNNAQKTSLRLTAKSKTHFRVDLANIRGLHSNLNAVQYHLNHQSPDMLFLAETQIKPPADTSYLNIPGYQLEHNFIPKAGVCLYVRSDVCCRRLSAFEDSHFSVLWVHVDLGTQSRIYVCLYRSHSGNEELTRLYKYLEDATDAVQRQFPSAELVFIGDFNGHHREWLGHSDTNEAGREAHSFALSHGLTQLVRQTTWIPANIDHNESLLDLFLTSDPSGYSVSVEMPLGSSDHRLIRSSVPRLPRQTQVEAQRRLWHYRSADWDGMREFFACFPWSRICFSSDDVSECADQVADIVRLGMEVYIPSSVGRVGGRHKPWFNLDCDAAIAVKRTAYKVWTRARARGDPDIIDLRRDYNSASRACKRVFARAKADHISRFGERLTKFPTGTREFWSLAKAAEANFCRSSSPPLQKPDGSLAFTSREKAELLVGRFAAASTLNDMGQAPPNIPRCPNSLPQVRFTQCIVRSELRNLDVRKATGPDLVPAMVLRACSAELTPVLTRLYRLSYKTSQVPNCWKLAHVQPIPKKGDRSDPANYRPIAITSIIGKVMERIINKQLLAYLEEKSLLSDRQYGFRHKRSAGDLLAYVTHLWSDAMDKFGEALAIALDIAKAFDRVWHAALLAKLQAFGLPPELCAWVGDFLTGRNIQVVIDGISSRAVSINAGVPQGSVLSPTLFLIFINDLMELGNIHCYADDSTVHGHYVANAGTTRDDIRSKRRLLVSEIDATLSRITDWGRANLVEFNCDKTQACAFSAKRETFQPSPQFQSVQLPIVSSIGVLGVDLSHDLNFRDHIEGKALIASKKLGILNKAREYFTPEMRLLLYKTQVRSCVEYSSHLWDGSAKYQLASLDKVQRRAARIVDSPNIYNTLETLQLRRTVGSLSLFYRLYHGECSEELFESIPSAPFHHRSTRRRLGMHSFTITVPSSRTKRSDRSFLIRTTKLWNALPATVFPHTYNMRVFKRNLKRHFTGRRAI